MLKVEDKKGMMKMQNKPLLKILAILFVLLLLVSCVTPSVAVDNPPTNNTLNSKEQNLKPLIKLW
jgi:uncharacterized lipoprotein YajG